MTNDELDLAVIHILFGHVGKANRVERWDLVRQVFGTAAPLSMQNDDHPQDREIRYAVSRLRRRGYLICDLGDGNGRYLAANENEFWELYNYYVKPIKARAEVARALKKAAAQKFPNLLQPSLFTVIESVDDLDVIASG